MEEHDRKVQDKTFKSKISLNLHERIKKEGIPTKSCSKKQKYASMLTNTRTGISCQTLQTQCKWKILSDLINKFTNEAPIRSNTSLHPFLFTFLHNFQTTCLRLNIMYEHHKTI